MIPLGNVVVRFLRAVDRALDGVTAVVDDNAGKSPVISLDL